MNCANVRWILSAMLLCAAVYVCVSNEIRKPNSNSAPVTPLSVETQSDPTTGHKAFLQQVDHENSSADHHKWLQYYYYNLQYVTKDEALFFLILGGNEKLDESCASSDNFMVVQWAKKYHAAVYCLEHRFYGQSQPFNATLYSPTGMTIEELSYLTSAQAIEDAASFIKSINEAYRSYSQSPRWILFGGFYGGSLALWLRQKYPELSIGAIVSSAPVMAKLDLYEYATIVENNYYRYNSVCADEIKQGFQNISQLLMTASGRDVIDKTLREMLFSGGFEKHNFTTEFMANIFYAMINNLALPSVDLNYEDKMKRACNVMANKNLTTVARLLGNMENIIMTEDLLVPQYEWNGDLRAWMWQRCNEFGFMESTDAQQSGSMFGGMMSTSYLIGICEQVFSTKQNAYNLEENIEASNKRYGGQFGYNGTNVVLVRGDIDPFNSLQHYVTSESTIKQYLIPGLARCADMYLSTYKNNHNFKYVQEQIETSIQGWLEDVFSATTLTSTTKQFIYNQKNPDFSQILRSHTQLLLTDGIPSIRFPLPDPANSADMLNYPPDFVTGIFKRTFNKPSGGQFILNQRFWRNMYYYEAGGPNFLILGGMGEASPKWILNTELPIMKLAKEYKANVYLLEHRYYGKSIPEGGLTLENLQYLNIDQVLVDIAEFIQQNEFVANEKQRWILFGGSYAGSLAAYFRVKYGDDYSIGAVASSAPLDTPVDFFDYTIWAEKAISTNSEQCSGRIMQQFKELFEYAYTSNGRQILSSALSLEPPWKTETAVNRSDLEYLFRNIISTYLLAVQFNGNPAMSLPADSISDICNDDSSKRKPIEQLATSLSNLRTRYGYGYGTKQMANSYTNYVNSLKNVSSSSAFAADRCRWYQMCNQLGQFPTTDTGTNIFDNILPVNFYLNLCKDIFGAKFTSDYIYQSAQQTMTVFGGRMTYKGTNVVFVNGDMDPWSRLSIRTTKSENNILAINIAGASHCSDMYPSTVNDSNALTSARIQIKNFISNLLNRTTSSTMPPSTITGRTTSSTMPPSTITGRTTSSTMPPSTITGRTTSSTMPPSTITLPAYSYPVNQYWYSYNPLSPILLIFMVILVFSLLAVMAFILAQLLNRRSIANSELVMQADPLPEKVIVPN